MVALAFFVAALSTAHAQAPSPTAASSSAGGIITGKITEAETGDVMRGATVQVIGTKKGAIVDVKGTYTIKGVPAGTYSLRFNYIGFKPKTVEGVEVKDGQTTNIVVALESAVKKTEEVVVEVKRLNDNASAILAQRKNAAQVSDGIGEAEIKKLPDSDAGQALRRVPGVTIVNNYVVVRGVGDRYNNTTLNGAGLTSTDPDKKSFAFDMFPAEFLQNANVAKSFTPDLPGNFAGGLVQLNTVDFPEQSSVRVSISGAYNTNVTLRNNAFLAAPSSSTDWLAFDNGLRALPAGMPANRREMNDLLAGVSRGDQAAITRWQNLGRAFNSNSLRQDRTTALPNGSFGLSFSNVFNIADNDFGVIASLNYGNGYTLNTIERNGILADRSPLFKLDGVQSQRNINVGGLLNFAYKIGDHSSISFKNVYNRQMDDEAVELQGQDLGYQFLDLKLFSFQYVEKELYSGQLTGEHTVKDWNNILIDWKVSYSTSVRNEPDFRRFRYGRQTAEAQNNPSLPFEAQVIQSQQGDGTRAGRFFSLLRENATLGVLNFTLPVNAFRFKLGGLTEFRPRSFNARSITIIEPRNAGVNVDYAAPMQDLFSPTNFRINGLGISEDTRLSDAYDATEQLVAGYAMADLPFELGGVNLRVIGGLRVESNTQILNSFAINDQPVNVNLQTTDVLPSLHFVWKASDAINVRLSGTQTLARPSLREFAPFAFFDFQQQALVQGNPELKRALIQNLDTRFEYFPAPGEVLSVSGFYKNFQNAIEGTIFPQQSELTFTFANADGNAVNYGFEVEVRKNLGFIGSFLDNFVLSANYTWIRSELTVTQGGNSDTRPMAGQSPFTLNVALYFTDPTTRTAITVGYNTFGRRIVQVGQRGAFAFPDPHIYELPRDVIDASIIQPIGESLEIKATARDILNQRLIWEQGGERIRSTIFGSTYSLGISYRFK
jgi:outer membrane receptor protein involved in Fe transport